MSDWSDFLVAAGDSAITGAVNFLGGWFGAEHQAGLSAEAQKRQFQYNVLLNEQGRDIQNQLAKLGFELDLKGADYAKQLRDKSVVETPGLLRAGLEAAGYNPILAVNSAAGQPFSTSINASVPGASTSSGPSAHPSGGSFNSGVRVLDSLGKLAAIRATNAQSDLIEKKALGEGWTIKTLSAGEAKGLGASLLGKLGFNFNGSEHQTFLVGYNPITGELRNLGNTKEGFLGTTGEPTSSVDVVPVDWKTDKSPRYKFNPDDWELKPEYRK